MVLIIIQTGGIAAAQDPTAPTLNSANYSDNGTALSFSAPTELIGTTITSYDYEISTTGGTSTTGGSYGDGNGGDYYTTSEFVGDAGDTSATSSPFVDPEGVTYCQEGTTCSYRIRAEFDNGGSITPWSGWVTETPFGAAPALNSVHYSDNGTALLFSAPTLSSGLTVTAYDYEISTNGGTSTTGGSYGDGNGGDYYTTSEFVGDAGTPAPRRALCRPRGRDLLPRRDDLLLPNPGRGR